MSQRRPLKASTVAAVAAENAGHPVPPERLAALAPMVEAMAQQAEVLRGLPLKEAEPACVFRPIETPKR
ncbi:MAG: hypothetical protein Kilf2KO_00550 [Rhodospirillales bacterium]